MIAFLTLERLRSPNAVERAATAVALAHTPRLPRGALGILETIARHDPDERARAAAAATLVVRASGSTSTRALRRAALDPSPAVRRRAAELAAPHAGEHGRTLLLLLLDSETFVAEAAAFALGEGAPDFSVITALVKAAESHDDPLVREAAVAALGSLGDPRGLPAILHGCQDRPAIRRRAVLALAAFEGEEVEVAIERASRDRDWQVRQAAEDFTTR